MSSNVEGVGSSGPGASGARADAGLNSTGGSEAADFSPPFEEPSDTPAEGQSGDKSPHSKTQGDSVKGRTQEHAGSVRSQEADEHRRTYNRLRDGLNGLAQSLLGDERWEELQGGKPDLDKRFEVYNQALQEKLDRLSQLETEAVNTAIKIDAPLGSWKVGEQLDSMPESYRDALTDTVFNKYLPVLVEEALTNPAEYPEE
ncbi:MAG TPA: hypothetical protein VEZ90_02660, partial [Blastocatellia bacterium]|nr:hypothetical protein [Blastocatellia bacterium]